MGENTTGNKSDLNCSESHSLAIVGTFKLLGAFVT